MFHHRPNTKGDKGSIQGIIFSSKEMRTNKNVHIKGILKNPLYMNVNNLRKRAYPRLNKFRLVRLDLGHDLLGLEKDEGRKGADPTVSGCVIVHSLIALEDGQTLFFGGSVQFVALKFLTRSAPRCGEIDDPPVVCGTKAFWGCFGGLLGLVKPQRFKLLLGR